MKIFLRTPANLINTVILFAIIYFISLSSLADTKEQVPKLKILSSLEGASFKGVRWPYKIKPIWNKDAEGGIEFLWGVKLKLPKNIEIANIQAKKSEIGIKEENSETNDEHSLYIGLRTIDDIVIITQKNNTQLELKFQLLFKESIIIEHDCEELNLKLMQTSAAVETDTSNKSNAINENRLNAPEELKSIPFYLAYKCEIIPSGIRLAVTSPEEMKWASNSLFETHGKGKNWKNFNLGVQLNNFNKQGLGLLEFEWKNNRYAFQIVVEKTEIVRPISAFVFSLGVMNASIKNSTTKISYTKPAAFVSFEIRPLNPNFSLGGEGVTTIPTIDPNNYYNHTETTGYLGYTLFKRPNWLFESRVYIYVVNGVAKALNYFYMTNNFAVGGILKYKSSQRNQFSLESHLMTLNSQSIVSVQGTYSRLNRNQIGGWGVSLVYQSLGMNLQKSDKSLASQFYFGPYLEF